MRVRDDLDIGVSTQTGPVRSSNEDDYLLVEPEGEEFEARGRLFVIADGMGGVAGGAEASRTAVRALAAEFLEPASGTVDGTLESGFQRAAREVYEASRTSVQLAEMGTTMTALCITGGTAYVAHVGDSRCVVLRDGNLVQLTEDHAVEEPRHLLTRCLGAGRDSEEVDLVELAIEVGDVFALLTDGVWDALPDAEVARLLRTTPAQAAATRLVEAAIEAGSTDNATAIVVRIAAARPGAARDVELPAEETILPLSGRAPVLTPPRWPWVVLVLAVLAAGFAIVRLALGRPLFG